MNTFKPPSKYDIPVYLTLTDGNSLYREKMGDINVVPNSHTYQYWYDTLALWVKFNDGSFIIKRNRTSLNMLLDIHFVLDVGNTKINTKIFKQVKKALKKVVFPC